MVAPFKPNLQAQYRAILSRLKVASIDLPTRRDILRDIYREIVDHPGENTPEEIIEILADRYDLNGLARNPTMIHDVLQMAQRQRAFDYHEQPISMASPVWLAPGIESEAEFLCRAEEDMVYAIIRAGVEVDNSELAHVMMNDRNQVDYVLCMLDNLKQRNWITRKGLSFGLPEAGVLTMESEPVLEVIMQDIDQIQIPPNMEGGSEMAHSLAKKAMVQRSQDFVASGNNYLMACRLQWEAVDRGDQGATLEDLRWFMASYAW